MKRIGQTLYLALGFAFAIVAQAQTNCPGSVAQITSPTAGSTLPAGAVTFAWCHANGDYFLDIASVPGAHDIFFAFLTVESVTLGPACNIPNPISPTTQCIVPNGETIYVTLWTNIAQSGRKNYVAAPTLTFTAANSSPTPVPTTTTVDNKTATASNGDQNITLTATVAGGTVNQGVVTFQVLDGATKIGAAVTTATLSTGSASVVYLLPGGTAAKTYTIQATYSGGTNFQPSNGNGSLTVNVAPPIAASTTTSVAPQTVVFSGAVQNVTLTATVTAASTVNEGTVTFQVMDGAGSVGIAVTSATLINGNASGIYALPAGLAVKTYTIQAAYSGGTNFLASSSVGTLTVNATPPPIQLSTSTTVNNNAATFSPNIQHVTLTAAVAVPGGTVNEGTVSFQVRDGATNIGTPVPSATLTNGSAAVSYTLPAGLAAKNYIIQAAYSGGADFLASSGTGTLTIFPPVSPSIAVFRSGVWILDNGNYAFDAGDRFRFFGLAGDQAVAGDWTGNGQTRLGVFRAGQWFLDLNNNGQWDGVAGGDGVFSFGMPGDTAVVGDWNGDGKTKLGIFRCPAPSIPGTCIWVLDMAGKFAFDPATAVFRSYGFTGDKPIVSRWTLTATADQIGVFRNGAWIVDSNGSGAWEPTDAVYTFGQAGDIPVVGNWNGDGTPRIGVFRPAGPFWVLDTNGTGAYEASDPFVFFGLPGDQPSFGPWSMP